ncbi:E1 [Procyon lotor papillomavirus 1]|uniref:Replication protein E1 n=1 Tax=Procyon lotor papillomavirus 1 TaxID=312349 RepID=Q4QW02_9PAPI|nr:E1 [Procyon lotor papillomavirus 1]AAW88323.1 E1 [Procyon lotor papillomavirus 1]
MVDKGTVDEESDWVLVEAECSDVEDDIEEFFDKSTSSSLADFVDNATVSECEGLSLELFRQQEADREEEHLLQLKRKYIRSPEKAVESLSPRLESISISPRKNKKAKKQLKWSNDSGLGVSQHEAGDSLNQREETQVELYGPGEGNGAEALFKSKNQRAVLFAKFKECFGLSFTDLTRNFKSDKTCTADWVVCGIYISEARAEAGKTLLQDHCEYVFVSQAACCALCLLSFKAQKNRETVLKLLKGIFGVRDCQLMAEPPRTRSAAAALYWYKRGMSNCAFTAGQLPEWIAKQTLLGHQLAAEKPFDLSQMVQWAYDNDLVEESEIAYQYALLGEEDENAAAFLNSNNQTKHVKDCAVMCRYYKKAERESMSMSEWIHRSCKHHKESELWREIVKFLRHQTVSFVSFIAAFKRFLRGVPKSNCIVIWGPPNTGKSLFCMTLLKFLKGRVISFVNSKSQFWLQPLADAKIGLLDDATRPCWDYFDAYMRNALDGNPICVDCKHKAPSQIKCPPLLITTNLNVMGDERWKYLRSRLSSFCFPTEFPFHDDGSPGFILNDESWASFFARFWTHLELSDPEDEGEDGGPSSSLRLCTRRTSQSL